MIPTLKKIDHVHVYVKDIAIAEPWYRDVLGFTREKAFLLWAVDAGPYTLVNPEGTIHLALFVREKSPTSTVAFNVSADAFLEWIQHLSEHGIKVEPSDHELAWSIYFNDLDENPFEITTYDYQAVKDKLV